jgi:pimeloyl-ACP methyl ester carboxylesterase
VVESPEMPGTRVKANGLELEYETTGNPADPAILLVAGFTYQLTSWDTRFCAELAARGFHVVRFDNRDVGLSSSIATAVRPNLMAIAGGDRSTVAYGLADMADDAAGLIEALGIAPANVVGASMGGMIAQTLALRHPRLVRSLVSIMSTTGDRSVGYATPEVMAMMLKRPPSDREGYIESGMNAWRMLRSPGFAHDEARGRERIAFAYDRAYSPRGVARQAAAIASQDDRTVALRSLRIPATVIHGDEDPLIHVSGGEATAHAIPGARLLRIPGMAHDLPEQVWPTIIDAIVETTS